MFPSFIFLLPGRCFFLYFYLITYFQLSPLLALRSHSSLPTSGPFSVFFSIRRVLFHLLYSSLRLNFPSTSCSWILLQPLFVLSSPLLFSMQAYLCCNYKESNLFFFPLLPSGNNYEVVQLHGYSK